MEVRALMMSTNNICHRAAASRSSTPLRTWFRGCTTQLARRNSHRGCYRRILELKDNKLDRHLRGLSSSPEEVRVAYDAGTASLHVGIRVRIDELQLDGTMGRNTVETTVGHPPISEGLFLGVPSQVREEGAR